MIPQPVFGTNMEREHIVLGTRCPTENNGTYPTWAQNLSLTNSEPNWRPLSDLVICVARFVKAAQRSQRVKSAYPHISHRLLE